jgi:integrase
MAKKYIAPRLVDYQGDVSKRWYIIFYGIDETTQKRVRKRYFDGLNDSKNIRDRYRAAALAMQSIRGFLAEDPTIKRKNSERPETSKKQTVLDSILATKLNLKGSSKNYLNSFDWIQKNLEKWCSKNGNPEVKKADTGYFLKFLEWFQNEHGFGPKTFNAYRAILLQAMGRMVLLGHCPTNPVHDVPKKKVKKGEKNLPYTREQVDKMKAIARQEGNLQWCHFIDFLIFTLARPRKEIHLLQVEDIRLKTIFIPKDRGKTGGRHIPILPPLEKLIQSLDLRNYPKEWYVFGRTYEPGPKPFTSTHFYDFFRKYAPKAGITDPGHTLYSFKHTGACLAYQANVPISVIQVMCGHESPSQTEAYLVNLGLITRIDPYLGDWPEY